MIGRLLCRLGIHSPEPYMVVDNSFTGCKECNRCEKHLDGQPDCKLWQRARRDGTMSAEEWTLTHTPMPHCNPDIEITFDTHVIGYGNDSHGDTCCLCGTLLPAVKDDGFSPRFPGIGQLEIGFRRKCSHSVVVCGGYVCSEACRIEIRAWLHEVRDTSICPSQHEAKGVAGHGPPASVFFDLMEELAARERAA